MVEWSLEAFSGCAAVVVAVPPGAQPDIRLVGPADRPAHVVEGGATRAESVSNALAVVETEVVAIHDAARPLVTAELLEALVADLEAAPEADAVIAASAVTDTVKRSSESIRQFAVSGTVNCRIVSETLDRTTLWAAQTPQVFRTHALRQALEVDEATRDAATDEAMLIEVAGGTVLLHEVIEPNLKVTTRADLRVAELLLSERA
jgi:2-C-methyl-D-erythritol 4-phosphate cytidylyltransferase